MVTKKKSVAKPASASKEAKPKEVKPFVKCLIDGCDNPAALRGLCRSCYSSARRMVKLGYTTWDVLVDNELAFEARRGRRPSTPFMRAFEAFPSSGN